MKLWTTTYKVGSLEVSGHIDGLYTWDEAMKLELPKGWRITSDRDWDRIEEHFNGDAKKVIKELCVVLAGYRSIDGLSYSRGTVAYFWSSSKSSKSGLSAWYRYLASDYLTVYRYPLTKEFGFSVRAVRDIKEGE